MNEGSISWVISAFTDDEITMIDSSGAVKALPGALNGSGTSYFCHMGAQLVTPGQGPLAPQPDAPGRGVSGG